MFKVLDGVGCPGASASADPWVPLSVLWQISLRGGPLYCYVTGDDGGYVELKIDPDSGALCALIVIDLPPLVDRPIGEARIEPGSLSPVFDLELWEWKTTPDYKEPAKHDIDKVGTLARSTSGEFFVLWFAHCPVDRYLECGEARVGVSSDGELVNIVVRQPPVIRPELNNR
jgi:hypothetical protein